ncbi:MAG: hypothetical protein H0W25_20840 [Acidimicrobiia bacterium]|nr:hypothetical protein [Acidimicrobiia bacterium]
MQLVEDPAGSRALQATGQIPATSVVEPGVEYFIELVAGTTRSTFPSSATAARAAWVVPVDAAPVVTHQPVLFTPADTGYAVRIDVSCPTGGCTATVAYRTSPTTAGTAAWDDPSWTRDAMNVVLASEPIENLGVVTTYEANIPGDFVDIVGVDYLFRVDGGGHTSYAPGTPVADPTLAQPTYFHTHVLEPPRLVHVPAATSPYRTNIPISATATCC